MKRNIALAWLITLLMTMVCSQAFAGSSQNLTMQDGETRTLYLPGEVTGKKFHSATYSSYGTSYVQILSVASDMRSVRVQALQPTSGSRITVQCTYKYFSTIGSFSQLVTGYYNFYILVEEVKPTSISISSSLPLTVGESSRLYASVSPSNAQYTLTWSSGNSSIAKVDQKGTVTGVSEGSTTITVKTNNGKSADCEVTVSPRSVKDVSIDGELPLEVGDTYTLTPVVTPSDIETSFTWSSNNDDVATVSATGEVTAVSEGDANITVETDNGKTATCKVSVKISEISGDANGDKEVNVADIVKLVNDKAPQAEIDEVVDIIMKK